MDQSDLFADPAQRALPEPSRQAGLERLKAFTSAMARHYAAKRNFDFGPDDRSNVSGLSPHVRHRLVSERELVAAALDRHGLDAAEKFIQEACWRTYWKGWLELRPSVWDAYRNQVTHDLAALEKDGALRSRYEDAVSGRTGISCFDAWAVELIEHGYLHNHARMWFASIWVYTLNLPWALGADVFYRHLMDGDAASNTLGWRWVCGLQTPGKTYLARASNINKYTDGRFSMQGYDLASNAPPLADDPGHPDPVSLKPGDRPDPDAPALILVHDEDGCAESWGIDGLDVRAIASLDAIEQRSPLDSGECARDFTKAALQDAGTRAAEHFQADFTAFTELDDLIEQARAAGARQIVTQRPHTGPQAERLAALQPRLESQGITLVGLRRDWDRAFHPHADRGFFKVKKKIPAVLGELGLITKG
ncbi:FAD-binding domain-containing protein [Maricaulaceae bacterium MS644]